MQGSLTSAPNSSFSNGVKKPKIHGGLAFSSHDGGTKDEPLLVIVDLFKDLHKQAKF
jgi:hypothetical protein